MMGDTRDDLQLGDEDRLPWLESAEEEERVATPWGAILGFAIGAVALVAIAWFGWQWIDREPTVSGSGELIAAAEGDYKVKPDEPGGMKATGDGDQSLATSEGGAANASVDLSAVPEAPVEGRAAPKTKREPDAGAKRVVAAVPDTARPLEARAPSSRGGPPTRSATSGGSVVQLGAFPSEAGANQAWATLSKRFAYLAPLGRAVERAEVNGRTVHRLRVNAGSAAQARELCGRLSLAGENCFVASE